ncbi:DUF4097 family beta strand repeat-containing protein [Pseudonocardia acaciae]|uniref:DUF4097 family beta strand repeat-containing protein n=1 Tax=Pseudonocardia acaciae TaxID=551276 RepID=UPI0007E8BC90|nr:DUF4097 family beta strand repeat-containing protein [Pseudonocardia acaciae]
MRKPRPGSRTAGTLVTGAVCLTLLSGCGLSWPSSKTLVDDATVASVRSVTLDNGSGNVTVRVEAAARDVAVHRTVTYRGDQPGPSYRVDGDSLRIGDCGRLCSVDYVLVVPAGTAVTGGVDSGDAEFAGVSSVTVSVGSGNVTARDVAGPVDVKVDSGDLRGTGLGGKVAVRSGSGDVRLDVIQPRDVHVTADSGDIDLVVPRGQYRVNATSDSGRVKTDMANDPAAAQLLELRTGSGDVTARFR